MSALTRSSCVPRDPAPDTPEAMPTLATGWPDVAMAAVTLALAVSTSAPEPATMAARGDGWPAGFISAANGRVTRSPPGIVNGPTGTAVADAVSPTSSRGRLAPTD